LPKSAYLTLSPAYLTSVSWPQLGPAGVTSRSAARRTMEFFSIVAPSVRREAGHRRLSPCSCHGALVAAWTCPTVRLLVALTRCFRWPVPAACCLPAGGARPLPHPDKARDATFREMQRQPLLAGSQAQARSLAEGVALQAGPTWGACRSACGPTSSGKRPADKRKYLRPINLAARGLDVGFRLRAISPGGFFGASHTQR